MAERKRAERQDKSAETAKAGEREQGKNGSGEVIFSLKAGTPIYVKTADICAATGTSNQWIGKLTKKNILHKTQTSHGALYELFETMRAYCEMLNERAAVPDEDTAAIEKRRKMAEAKLKESKASIAEMEAKEFQGKLHRSEDVQAMTADLLFFVRGSLTALAGRCAAECAAASEPAEVQKLIEKEVFAILRELSEYSYSKSKYEELVRQRGGLSGESIADSPEDDTL